MDYKQVRKGITQSKDIEDKSGIIYGEIFVIVLAIGLKTESWWWGGGIFFLLIILINIKKFVYIFSIVFSIFWGMVGYAIGSLFESMGAMVVLAILGFMISLGTHLSGIEEMEDLKS